MQKHLTQAEHNQEFYTCICEDYSTQFFDWKITTLFYTVHHWLKALAAKRGVDIGDSHEDVDMFVNPKRSTKKMQISKTAWRNYRKLKNDSQTARYEGFTDTDTFQKLKELDHIHCRKCFEEFSKYISDQGVAINNK